MCRDKSGGVTPGGILMVDRVDQATRSRNMSQIRSTNSHAEIATRRIAHAMGYRFRIHRRDLPGTPDLTFPSRQAVLFVNGCFWHRHPGCGRAAMPKTYVKFWENKFRRTLERDRATHAILTDLGWRVAVIWECEIHDRSYVEQLLRRHLETPIPGRIEERPHFRKP
jgi:DNA mismatch endonuclease (patch repair protein)